MKEYLQLMYKGTKKDYYEYLDNLLENDQKKFIITANPETLSMAETDKEISKMLLDTNNSVVPDGVAVIKAGKLLKVDFKERIPGVDICEYLLKYASKHKKKVYIFGSKEETLIALSEKIKSNYSGINLVGLTNGYVEDRDKEFEKIKKAKPDIVIVALGIPYQERLIYKHLKDFNKGIFIGVGGSLDVLSGCKKRAPKIFIKLNLEWLYRIICEPKRIKRFINNNVKFVIQIKKESKGKNND